MKVRAETRPLTAPLLAAGGEGATVAVEPLLCGRDARARAPSSRRAEPLRDRAHARASAPRARSWWTVPIPAFLSTTRRPGRSWSTPACTPRSPRSRRRTWAGLVASFARPTLEPGEDLPAQLRARGIDPKSIGLVVMTHLHFDHTSGMSEFPGATFVLTEDEWVAATTDSRPLLRGYRPAHYDYAFDYRTLSYDSERISSYSTFGRTFDLFGDGSVRLASTPGHSAGHQSVICRLRDRDLVIAGDAIYTIGQLDDAPEPPRPFDRHNWRRSLRELQPVRAPVPAGRDRPRPRPGALGDAREALRVAGSGLGAGEAPATASAAPSRSDLITLERPRSSSAPYIALTRSKISLAASSCCSRSDARRPSKLIGSPYWTVTFGNESRFQARTPCEPWIATGTTGTPGLERQPADARLGLAEPAGARAPALGVHQHAAAAVEDRVGGDERLLVVVAAAHREHAADAEDVVEDRVLAEELGLGHEPGSSAGCRRRRRSGPCSRSGSAPGSRGRRRARSRSRSPACGRGDRDRGEDHPHQLVDPAGSWVRDHSCTGWNCSAGRGRPCSAGA